MTWGTGHPNGIAAFGYAAMEVRVCNWTSRPLRKSSRFPCEVTLFGCAMVLSYSLYTMCLSISMLVLRLHLLWLILHDIFMFGNVFMSFVVYVCRAKTTPNKPMQSVMEYICIHVLSVGDWSRLRFCICAQLYATQCFVCSKNIWTIG